MRTSVILRRIFLCIILSGAAVSDLRCRRVSNRWLLPGFLLEAALAGPGFLWPAFLTFFPVYFLFRMRLMGAGDGKVLMLIAGSLGFEDASYAIFWGFALAALWSVIRIRREKSLTSRLFRIGALAGRLLNGEGVGEDYRELLLRPENSIPLAACLAAGSILYMSADVIIRFEEGILI